MRRAIVTSTLASVTGAAVLLLSSGAHTALVGLGLLLGVCGATLAGTLLARRARRRVGSLSRQLALAVGIAVGAILASVWLAAGVMFISEADAVFVSVMTAVIAIVGMSVAGLLTQPLLSDIDRLRDRLRAVGAGERRTDLSTAGNDELADLARAANAMIGQLAEEESGRAAAERARRELMVAVSHDLRTPLAALRVLTEAIEDRVATGATRTRYLREMQTHVSVLSSLIDDLFELSRAQAGEIRLTRRPTEIGELTSETVGAMRTAAEERGVSLSVEPAAGRAPGQPLVAEADAAQVRRVIFNLLENAIRHSPAGGNVIACVARVDGAIEVQVLDEGPGIAASESERVFEPFYRGGEDSSRTSAGTGLGLAIARAIVEAHGGRIWLATSRAGARVHFSLPACDVEHAPVPELPDGFATQIQPAHFT
jgi:signal transduction histidine kinase